MKKETLKTALFFGTILVLIITIHLLTPVNYR
jgi:hypothetical protein